MAAARAAVGPLAHAVMADVRVNRARSPATDVDVTVAVDMAVRSPSAAGSKAGGRAVRCGGHCALWQVAERLDFAGTGGHLFFAEDAAAIGDGDARQAIGPGPAKRRVGQRLPIDILLDHADEQGSSRPCGRSDAPQCLGRRVPHAVIDIGGRQVGKPRR